MAVGDAHVFPGFLTPVLTKLFFPKPPTTFLTCFCRGVRRKYAEKKVRLNRGYNDKRWPIFCPRVFPIYHTKVIRVCIHEPFFKNVLSLLLKIFLYKPYGLANQKLCFIQIYKAWRKRQRMFLRLVAESGPRNLTASTIKSRRDVSNSSGSNCRLIYITAYHDSFVVI